MSKKSMEHSTGLLPYGIPRGTPHGKKITVSLYLSKNVVDKAKFYKLNISRITEKVLTDIINYLETENIKTTISISNCEAIPNSQAGPVAQQGLEHRAFNPGVAGSNPAGPAIIY